MNGAEARQQAVLPLRDIHLPPLPGWWPPAPGWWLVLTVLCCALTALFFAVRRHNRLRYRREALQQLKELEKNRQMPSQTLLAELSALLRRVSRCTEAENASARLIGQDWLRFLDQNLPDAPFSRGPGRILEHGPYRPASEFDRDALIHLCRQRINTWPPKTHRRRQAP